MAKELYLKEMNYGFLIMFVIASLGAVPHCIRATSDRVELTAVPEAIS
jgi:hypothetical protein